MPVTQIELESFNRYVTRQIQSGEERTLEDCLRMWRADADHAETIASIQRGMDEETANRIRPLAAVDAELRAKHGIAKDG